MSIGVNVNGTFHVLPKVIPVIDASELVAALEGATGILAIIGTGTGLIAPKTFHQVAATSGTLNRQYVEGSDVLTAARLAINPSGQVPGASQLRIITPNLATQPSLTLQDTTGTPVNVITLTAHGYGTEFHNIKVAVDNTAKEVTITYKTTTEIHTYGVGAGALAALVAKINDRSGLVTAALLAAGNETLATISATALAGAVNGTPSTQDWTDCLDEVARHNVNLVLALDSTLTIQQLLVAHCQLYQRIGFCGYSLQTGWNNAGTRATNLGNLKTRAAALGSPNVMFSGIGTDGFASYLSVAKYAGIAAGIPPSVPLNNKDLQTTTVEADLFIEEAEDLLLAGVSPPYRRLNPERPGFVISDGLSTYTGDDNLFNRIISVRRAAYGMMNEIVNELEQFLGQEAIEVVVGRVITTVDRMLQQATKRDAAIRIQAYDRASISATFEGTVLRVYYSFFPVQPIRFIVPIASLRATIIEQVIEIPVAA
jgi:hypothetical protein